MGFLKDLHLDGRSSNLSINLVEGKEHAWGDTDLILRPIDANEMFTWRGCLKTMFSSRRFVENLYKDYDNLVGLNKGSNITRQD